MIKMILLCYFWKLHDKPGLQSSSCYYPHKHDKLCGFKKKIYLDLPNDSYIEAWTK